MSLFYLKIPFSEIINYKILLSLLWLLHCSFLIFALFSTLVICMTPRYLSHFFFLKYFPYISISLYFFRIASVGLFSLCLETIKSIFKVIVHSYSLLPQLKCSNLNFLLLHPEPFTHSYHSSPISLKSS